MTKTPDDFTGNCDRCSNSGESSYTMSMFNEDWVCEECKDKEVKHPKYEEACRAEADAIKNGDTNFPGIGKPEDL